MCKYFQKYFHVGTSLNYFKMYVLNWTNYHATNYYSEYSISWIVRAKCLELFLVTQKLWKYMYDKNSTEFQTYLVYNQCYIHKNCLNLTYIYVWKHYHIIMLLFLVIFDLIKEHDIDMLCIKIWRYTRFVPLSITRFNYFCSFLHNFMVIMCVLCGLLFMLFWFAMIHCFHAITSSVEYCVSRAFIAAKINIYCGIFRAILTSVYF